MKQLNYIGIICAMALVTAPAVADIASSEYVDSVVGTMTQSAINTALANKQDKLPTAPNDGKKYSLIWNGSSFAFEEFTTGGGSTPIDLDAIFDYLDYDETSDKTFTYAGYEFANRCEGANVTAYGDDTDDWYYDSFGVDEGGSCSDSEFSGMVAGDWYIDIPSPINVKIEGRALCSSTTNGTGQVGDPDGSGSGQYCWCKMTSPAASRWVLRFSEGNADYCAHECANDCARGVYQGGSLFRSAMLGSIEQ